MNQILKDLNQKLNLLGSMVMTPDGMPVASELDPNCNEDSMAAMVSSLVLSLKRSLSELETENPLISCILNATAGKLLLVDMESTYLAALAPHELNVDVRDEAFQEAVDQIKNRRFA